MTGAWHLLTEEVARWHDAGRQVEFWWRDDDAAKPNPALERLLKLSADFGIPAALAVVPAGAEAAMLAQFGEGVSVLQHGTDHVNRAGPGEKKTEFSAAEPVAAALARLAFWRARLEVQAGARFVPALAPPWNRIPAPLIAGLATAGFAGLSQYGIRTRAEPAPGLRQVNTHVDLIAWKGGRGFIGEEEALRAALRHLAARRIRAADGDEATGWLTHHALHDRPAWDFLKRLFETTRALPGVAWRRAEELFHVP